MRGTIAFIANDSAGTSVDEQHQRLAEAHRTAVGRLRAKGCLPAPRTRAEHPQPPVVAVPPAGQDGHTDGREIAERLAMELREHMYFRSLPADQVREYLSRVVGQWASDNGWQPEREAPTAPPRPSTRPGRAPKSRTAASPALPPTPSTRPSPAPASTS